jgi:hypothetical protein
MSYRVLWQPKAEQALAELWMDAANRSAITAAARGIDEQLRTDPENVGESRWGDKRILLVPLLGVDFTIDRRRRLVSVLAVWDF